MSDGDALVKIAALISVNDRQSGFDISRQGASIIPRILADRFGLEFAHGASADEMLVALSMYLQALDDD